MLHAVYLNSEYFVYKAKQLVKTIRQLLDIDIVDNN